MESEEMVHELVWLEVWRQHREDLLEEAKNARLAREIHRRRREAPREWKITLGGWTLRIDAEVTGGRSVSTRPPRRALEAMRVA
jgi:hypothetical protein